MKPANPKHKFQVTDMNGFPRTSATKRNHALKNARELARASGLDMIVSWRERAPFYGMRHRAVVCRCKERALLARRHYALNGQAFLAGGQAC